MTRELLDSFWRAMLLDTLVFAFSSLRFAHDLLAALKRLRAAAAGIGIGAQAPQRRDSAPPALELPRSFVG
jgi:hypothetical protein